MKVKGGANRPSKSRLNSPYHDHRTPRERFRIMHRDNAEWPKMLNNPKHLSIPARRHSRSRLQPLCAPKYSLERHSKSRLGS